MQQKAILLAHPYLQLVSGSVRRNQFDFDSNTLSINMTTGAVNGVSVIPISPPGALLATHGLLVRGKPPLVSIDKATRS